nr:DUF2927 domain-containing protein [Aquicoccus sp. G2-2]MEA1114319.1 DUF2927 domain-containing protein [Aquicoccus sp. G2-2]
MGQIAKRLRCLLPAFAGLVALSACIGAPQPTLKPQTRPAGLENAHNAAAETPGPESRALRRYYTRIQNDLLARGLMRTDGGGPDTQFTKADLLRDFRNIAFYNEHSNNHIGLANSSVSNLHRWEEPVRMKIEFGTSVPAAQRAEDTAFITNYAARLHRISGHPIGITRSDSANFHVLVSSVDDRDQMIARIHEILPDASDATLNVFRRLSRSTYCLVVAEPGGASGSDYQRAVALIRAEHPPFMRHSCIHEELAQGLGLTNDSPKARPSIFNDDEEFAYLTTHDEMLLKMLYDPRLKTGMSIAEAMPIAARIADELTANNF